MALIVTRKNGMGNRIYLRTGSGAAPRWSLYRKEAFIFQIDERAHEVVKLLRQTGLKAVAVEPYREENHGSSN